MPFDVHFCKDRLKRYDDVDLGFLILEFPAVNDQISYGMRRDEKILLLLQHCIRHLDDADRLQELLTQKGQPAAPAQSLLEKAEPWNLDFNRQIDACSEPVFFDRPRQLVGLVLRSEDQDVFDSFHRRLYRELTDLLAPGFVVDRRSLMIRTTSTTLEKAIQRVRDDFLPDAQSDSVLFMTQMAGADSVLAFWQALQTDLQDSDLPNPMFVLLPVEPKFCQECPTALADLGLADLGAPTLALTDIDQWIQDVGGCCQCSASLKIAWKKHFWQFCRGDLQRAYTYLSRIKMILTRDNTPANIQRQLGL